MPPAGVRRAVVASAFFAVAACGGDRLVLGGGGDSGCVPGTYAGTVSCSASADASAQATPVGSISLRLEGDRGAAALLVGDGSVLFGSQGGPAFRAGVSGMLDCVSYELHASYGDLTFGSSGQTVTVSQGGAISADYDASAPDPALVNGETASPLPSGLPGTGLSTTCTWSATLH